MSSKNGEIPNEKWGLDKLGKYCAERHQRVGLDVWLIGRAMCLAKARCRKEKHDFTAWKKQHGFSNSTASRYMRLFATHQSDESLEQLKIVGPLQAYVEAGIERPRKHVSRQTSAERSTKQDPSWAVPDDDEPPSEQEETDQSILLTPTKDCIEHEIRNVFPWQVTHLKERTTFLLGQDADLLREALPKHKRERDKIEAEINALVQMLARLAAIFSCHQENKAAPAA